MGKNALEMVPDKTQVRSMRLWSDPIALDVASDQTKVRSKRLWSDPIALEVASDQTKVHSKRLWSDPIALEVASDHRQKCPRRGYDQTQLRSKSPLIRPKCARIRLSSDFSDQNDLWSDHLQTMVQAVVRSNFRKDPVISVWEHTIVRSTGSDHNSIWVWTSTWALLRAHISLDILSFIPGRGFRVIFCKKCGECGEFL